MSRQYGSDLDYNLEPGMELDQHQEVMCLNVFLMLS